jgi:hypothetical protein
MLVALVVLLRSLSLIGRGHRAVPLENLALRQRLAVVATLRGVREFRTRDRLFWVLVAKALRDWRTALIVVEPDTISCVGIANGSVAVGPNDQRQQVRAARAWLRPFRHDGRGE